MSDIVELSEIVDALECSSEELQMYFDKTSGELFPITDDELALADGDGDGGDEDIPDWQQETIEKAKEILADEAGERYIQLPDQFEINEHDMMLRFGRSIDDDELSASVLGAIYGSGAYGRFAALIRASNIEKQWFAFKREQLKQIAVVWCDQNEIEYKE
jgi:Uncharacterised protein family (UPF0158).